MIAGMKNTMLGLAAAAALCSFSLEAKVDLGVPFADGAVLQRGREVPVWGTADPGAKVKVSFAGMTREATAGADGKWCVKLGAMGACCEGRTLSAESGGAVASAKDVLVGEVWFCSGQSNTELPLCGGNPHFRDAKGAMRAGMTRKPLVRFCCQSNYRTSVEPKKTAALPVVWRKFTPENLRTPSFSAMGVYFAIALYNALDVPVGIVGSYWGGTNIDAWTPREGYAGAPESIRETAERKVVGPDEWNDSMKKGPVGGPNQQPTVLWNEMVAPWCPMTMKGFIWYQGCHNGGEAHLYCDKMHALYKGWSAKFENPGLKLYFVQLAPWEHSWWNLQMAQAKFAAEEPNAGLVTSVDVGNSYDIHPVDKGPLGRRLAALALRRDYGFSSLVADAPTVSSVKTDGDKLVLTFDNADGWYVYNADWGVGVPFEIAGDDGEYKPARVVNANNGAEKGEPWKTNGTVKGKAIVLAAEGVASPTKVRYLFQRPWNGNLFATSGLPLGPFEASVERK